MSPREPCPVCGSREDCDHDRELHANYAPVAPHRAPSAPPKATPVTSPVAKLAPDGSPICPYCKIPVRIKKFERHMRRMHGV